MRKHLQFKKYLNMNTANILICVLTTKTYNSVNLYCIGLHIPCLYLIVSDTITFSEVAYSPLTNKTRKQSCSFSAILIQMWTLRATYSRVFICYIHYTGYRKGPSVTSQHNSWGFHATLNTFSFEGIPGHISIGCWYHGKKNNTMLIGSWIDTF